MLTTRPTFYALPLIGWKEEIGLPELGLGKLIAKIDTGARSAALHAENIAIMGRRVSFTMEMGGRKRNCIARLSELKRVKSSNGHSELRPLIETDIEIGAHRFSIIISLTDRTDMGVPMLLGREAIKGRFLVHPAKRFVQSRSKVQA